MSAYVEEVLPPLQDCIARHGRAVQVDTSLTLY
jgi:hypothetical protein